MKPEFISQHPKMMAILMAAMLIFLSALVLVTATREPAFIEDYSKIGYRIYAMSVANWFIENLSLMTRPALADDQVTRYFIASDAWVEQAKLTAGDGAFMDQFGASVSISGNTLVVGARYDNNQQGSAYVFEKPVNGWTDMNETAKLTASDGAFNHQFGVSVAISGSVVVVGARGFDGFKGAAYVFERPVGGWTDMTATAKLTASDAAASAVFGSSVAISGDTLVVGANGDTQNGYKSGSAYVFEKPVGGWADMTETAKLTAADGAAYDDFGYAVTISGDTVIVGANGDDLTYAGQGSAYVFERPAGGWVGMTQSAKLTASDAAELDFFGGSVFISMDTVVIGAPGVDLSNGETIYDVGRAYVFERPLGGWTDMTETAKLSAGDGEANDEFGYSAGISGDTVVVGAWGGDGYIGAAYIFEKPVGGWADMTETAKLSASDGVPYDDFGYAVAISMDTVVAGAHLDDDNGNSSGAAYVFTVSDVCEGDYEPDSDVDGSDVAAYTENPMGIPLGKFANDLRRTNCP
jgi:hypothetical protein